MSDTSDDISDKSLRDRVHFEVPVLADQLYRSPDRQALRADTIDRLTQALAEANARADRMREALERAHDTMHESTAVLTWDDSKKVAAVMAHIRAVMFTPPDTAKRAAALSDLAALDGESL